MLWRWVCDEWSGSDRTRVDWIGSLHTFIHTCIIQLWFCLCPHQLAPFLRAARVGVREREEDGPKAQTKDGEESGCSGMDAWGGEMEGEGEGPERKDASMDTAINTSAGPVACFGFRLFSLASHFAS